MKKTLTFTLSATLVVGAILLANPIAWPFERPVPIRIPEDQIFAPFLSGQSSPPPLCVIQNDNGTVAYSVWGIDSAWAFAVHMDPATCPDQPTYPFKITDAHFYLFPADTALYSWPVNIQVSIKEIPQGGTCEGPDPVTSLWSESFVFPVDSSLDSLGRAVNFIFSQPYCVNEPFFLEIKYLNYAKQGKCHPSPLMDDTVTSADTCNNWGMTAGQYEEWCDFWGGAVAGDLMIRATGYTDGECEDLWYWKADKPTQDPYPAPSGMPDFDQYQFSDSGSLCGPTAVANCLWWFNAVPREMTPPDLIRLLCTYMKCDPYGVGTYVDSMELGLDQYISDYGFNLYEHTYYQPDFHEMEDSLKKSQDIILLLGFYDEGLSRVGGHYVTMAGVCSESLKVAFSDPAKDAAVWGWSPGRVRLGDHPEPPVDPTLHNNPSYVSQDIYISDLQSPTPGNPNWGLSDYLLTRGAEFAAKFLGQNFQPGQEPFKGPDAVGPAVYTEVEFAVMICPTGSAVEEEEGPSVPRDFRLDQNYPNPFNNETVIKFNLRKPTEVNLAIYNILGQRVRTLVEGRLAAGSQTVSWDGKDEKGNDLSSGIYFYQLKAGQMSQTKRLVLLK